MSVEIKNLTKTYGTQKAVDGISFKVNTGQIIGFIGPNGSGKSTTMKCICGVLPPNKGEVYVDGKNVYKEIKQIKKIIGYLPEHNPLYYEMYISEYLLHVANFYNLKERKKRVKEVIISTGLKREEHKKIGQLSKGYKQRVGLAQALIHDPKVLILDEPTTGLDPNQIVEIRSLISSVAQNKTVILSTHILQEVEAICDRVLIINKGKIVADDKAGTIKQETSKGLETIFVEFDTEVRKDKLITIPGVIDIKSLSTTEFLLSAKQEEDIRGNIFSYAIENHIKLLTIQKKEESLEASFRKLTNEL